MLLNKIVLSKTPPTSHNTVWAKPSDGGVSLYTYSNNKWGPILSMDDMGTDDPSDDLPGKVITQQLFDETILDLKDYVSENYASNTEISQIISRLNTLVGADEEGHEIDVTSIIDTFNEIKDFLANIEDTTLIELFDLVNTRINTLTQQVSNTLLLVGIDDIPEFDSTKNYSTNDLVIYSDKLYKFIETHSAGAWIGTDTLETDLIKEIGQTYSLVESVNNALDALNPDQQEALGVATKANANEAKLGYYVCDTNADTAAKTIAATGYVLGTGGNIRIKMTNANTVNNATLNINSTGAKPLFYEGVRASSTNSWAADDVLEIYYDGTNYQAKNVSPTFKTGEKVNSVGVDDEPTAGSENVVKSGGAFAQYFYFIYSSIPSKPDVNKVYYNPSDKRLHRYNGTSWETIPYHSNILYCRENIGKQNAPILYKYNEEDNDLVPLGYDYLLLNKVRIPASSSAWEEGLYYNTSTKLIRYYTGSYWQTYDIARENCLYFCLSDSRLYRYNVAEQTLEPIIDYDGYNHVLDSYTNDRYVIMERGTIDPSGNNSASTTRMRLVDYVQINEDVSIQCDFASIGLRYYDVNKDFIGSSYTDTAKYLRFFLYDNRMTEQTANNEFLKNKSIVIGGLVYKFHKDKNFVEDTERYFDSNWKGKKIAWFGTSIPNGKYPQIVGYLLGANILNKSVGASVIAVGYRDGQIPNDTNQQRAFSATKAEKEALFGTDSYNKYSFEELLIPYLDGTYEAPDAIVLEYGSDWNKCKNDEDRSNFSKLNQDSSDVNTLPNDSLTSSLGVNFNRYTYTGAMLFIIHTILKYKPYMRIYVVGYLNDMRRVGDAPAMRNICDYWQIPYCDISSLLGWSDRIIPGSMELFNTKYSPQYTTDVDVTQFKMWCPDDWHPHTNFNTLSNGYKESNYFLATKVAKWLNNVF